MNLLLHKDKYMRFFASFTFAVLMFWEWSTARVVEVEGIGYTREGAVRAALRSAVEQCAGISIDSRTLIENHQLVSDKILTHSAGYVSSHTVLSESAEFGLVRVRVSADVSLGKLEGDLAAQKLLYELQNRPRIMVVLDEQIEGRKMPEKTATHKVEEYLLSRGFIVVEPEQFEKVTHAKSEKDLASLAFIEGADLIINGAVMVGAPSPVMVYETEFYSVPAQINARIVRADNAQVISSRTKRIKKNSRDAQSAAQFGLEIGGAALAQELVDDLNKFWRSEEYNENRTDLIITGCSAQELGEIEKLFRGLSFTRELRLRYLEGTNALYDLNLRGTVQEVRAALAKENRLGLSIDGMTARTITLKKDAPESPLHTGRASSALEIGGFSVQEIFPSRSGYYAMNPAAAIRFQCGGRELKNLKVSVVIPEIMGLPAEKIIDRISPSTGHELPLSLVLDNEKLFKIADTRTVYGQATISFTDGGEVGERKLTAPVKIHEKNAMDWQEPDAIGSFITCRVPVITDLAALAVRAASSSGSWHKDLAIGMALFESIRSIGVSYIKDPASLPGTAVLDRVQFPQETLDRLGGDCDDLAVLYAALLSAVDIPAALITYSDHVLVMFDTKISRKHRFSLAADSLKTIIHNGTVWIPVETTMLGKGFTDAWYGAASEFHAAIGEQQRVGIIELADSWKNYPPAPQPEYKKRFSPKLLSETVKDGILKLDKSSRAGIRGAIGRLETEASLKKGRDRVAAFNTLGMLNVRLNNYKEAIKWFEKALTEEARPEIAGNAACAILLAGDEKGALERLDKIYKSDKTGRIAVNRALCLYVKARTPQGIDVFVNALKEAAAMLPSASRLGEYLGIDLTETAQTVKAAEKPDSSNQREVNLRRLRELIRQRVLSGSSSETSSGTKVTGTTSETSSGSRVDSAPPLVMPFGGIRGADPNQVAAVRDLIYWFE